MPSNSGTTWRIWSGDCTTNGTTASSGEWQAWMGMDTATSGTSANTVWLSWTSSSGNYIRVAPRQQTAEELATQAAQREQWAREAEERRLAEVEATRKADELLAMFLTPEQRDELARQSAFVVESEMGKKYRIKRGWSHNVEELDAEGKVVGSHCIHPSVLVPHGDNMLAQKIMLENREADFRRIANFNPVRH